MVVIPHGDYRGTFEVGHFPDGKLQRCTSTGCITLANDVEWPAKNTGVWNEVPSVELKHRFGSLLANKRDGSGLLYMRNRYYDPYTGRFTQEDPIGLAGGLNLYGYAGGDPVNYWDPFGLSECKREGDSENCPIQLDAVVVTATPKRRATRSRWWWGGSSIQIVSSPPAQGSSQFPTPSGNTRAGVVEDIVDISLQFELCTNRG